jgi:hypothetical protein
VSAPNGCFISFVQNRFQQTIGGQKDFGTGIRRATGVNKAHGAVKIADDLDGNCVDFRVGVGKAHQSHNGAGIDLGVGKDAIGNVIQELDLPDLAENFQGLGLGILNLIVDKIAYSYSLGIGGDKNILVGGFTGALDSADYFWGLFIGGEDSFWIVSIVKRLGDPYSFFGHQRIAPTVIFQASSLLRICRARR